MEVNKPKNKELKGKGNPLFAKIAREQQRRKAARLEQLKEVQSSK